MKSVSINGIARVDLGKKFAKQLRKQENVPCVIYGGKEGPIHFYAHTNEFRSIVYTPNVYLIDIKIDNMVCQAIMGDIQFHPVTDKILHIDFLRVFEDQAVKINVPVNIFGNSIGVRNGGRLAMNMRRMLIEALPANLPESIDVDITNVKIGQSIRVKDISLENIRFLNNSDDVIVAVKTARAAILEDEELEEVSEESGEASEDKAGGEDNTGGENKPAAE
tara:strand:+ start:107 stop:769 length:663 start_codon:yes stop_codon:yes gene_type:complete